MQCKFIERLIVSVQSNIPLYKSIAAMKAAHKFIAYPGKTRNPKNVGEPYKDTVKHVIWPICYINRGPEGVPIDEFYANAEEPGENKVVRLIKVLAAG